MKTAIHVQQTFYDRYLQSNRFKRHISESWVSKPIERSLGTKKSLVWIRRFGVKERIFRKSEDSWDPEGRMVVVGCAGGNHNARWISVDFKSAVAGSSMNHACRQLGIHAMARSLEDESSPWFLGLKTNDLAMSAYRPRVLVAPSQAVEPVLFAWICWPVAVWYGLFHDFDLMISEMKTNWTANKNLGPTQVSERKQEDFALYATTDTLVFGGLPSSNVRNQVYGDLLE